MNKLTRKWRAYSSAFKAGLIANKCPICVVDNEAEEIRACILHEAEIARLAKINEENN